MAHGASWLPLGVHGAWQGGCARVNSPVSSGPPSRNFASPVQLMARRGFRPELVSRQRRRRAIAAFEAPTI
eukprot:8653405-Pyramimonas_sp.AAC.1